jgi:cytochrome c biogenesis protein
MSAIEETIVKTPIRPAAKTAAKDSALARFLKFLCSVRLGIVLLILLALACLIGMLVMQQNLPDFANYYAQLTPAQQLIYGKLGFFDIYHSWYFNALLAFLSLNIILASIDRFPKTWALVSKTNLTVPLRWLREQEASDSFAATGSKDEIVSAVKQAYRKAGWRKIAVNEKNNRTFVFAESGKWNRLGAYAVHVGLLTIFLGGFLTAQLGQTGNMPLAPGQTSGEMSELAFELDQMREVKKRLPFEVTATDIQQKLLKDDGSLSAANTIDWITRFTIKDETGTTEGFVQMNKPFDYRGYRFFQASFVSTGRARNITVRAKPANGAAVEDITIPRNGAVTLPDGTNIKFAEFRGNFAIGPENPNEDTSHYPNPAAVLQITPPGGIAQIAYAFNEKMADIPVAKNPVGGYTYQLLNFEKVSDQHILSIQRDPGADVVYIGFALLCATLVAVFFFSHQRVWTAIEETETNRFEITTGANTNRNQNGLDEKFKRFIRDLREQTKEA